jgi:hypothetical protein
MSNTVNILFGLSVAIPIVVLLAIAWNYEPAKPWKATSKDTHDH